MRKKMRHLCLETSAEEAERLARCAAAHLSGLQAFREAKRVAVHLSLPDELPTQPVLKLAWEKNKLVLVPRVLAGCQLEFVPLTQDSELERNALGIDESVASVLAQPLAPGDLLLVPGLAFDNHGGRLGRGAGYYDRTLEEVAALGVEVIGWAYSFQLVAQVPMEAHDQRVSGVITDAE
jgi:5-formyltetrahydrofolate cyclo-ligase